MIDEASQQGDDELCVTEDLGLGAGDLRRRRIEELRRAVSEGSYDNPLKLAIAVDRMVTNVTNGGRA